MTTTTRRARSQIRKRRSTPGQPLREVCLVGDPARRYLHIPINQESPGRTEDAGLGTEDCHAR
jgi:hypothetical protein